MPLQFNLRQLETKNLHLKGELPLAELDLGFTDELIHANQPLSYDLEVQKLEDSLLVQGTLKLPLDCECARCLKQYKGSIDLDGWACHLPFQGEDPVVISNDCVDLTPYIREDILLSVPQHPLCEPDCRGLVSPRKDTKTGGEQESKTSSAWAELNKLKF
jgi:uncharacterized metal-binding protein YceD (DUF177 family)